MRDFWKTVGAYLTGWVIAQSIFNRVLKHYRETDWEDEKDDIADRAASFVIARLGLVAVHSDLVERVLAACGEEPVDARPAW